MKNYFDEEETEKAAQKRHRKTFHDEYEETLQLVSPFLLEKSHNFVLTKHGTNHLNFYVNTFDRDRDDRK